MKRELVWKNKFNKLQNKLILLEDEISNVLRDSSDIDREGVPDYCISASKEFFISNDMNCVDNETYAMKNWGKGKYFKVMRVDQ